MNKIYYLIIFIISFSVLSAQEKLSKEEKARREKNIQAGNPFAKYGSKAPVATLSKGKYLEVHDLDSIVTIGTSRWHVDKKQIVGNIVQDSLNPDAQPIGDRAGRWMSPDPLSDEFPSTSPYVSFNNNPLFFTDPTGMAPIPPDWYIDNRTGRIIGQDGASTNNYRLVDGRDFADIKSSNGGSTLSASATSQLQNAEISKVVTYNDAQIQQEIQTITDLSRTNEHQTDIILDKYTAVVSALRGEPGPAVGGSATFTVGTTASGATVASNNSFLIGNVHGHNLTTEAGKINVTGTSATDRNSSMSTGVTIYATDAYNTAVGGSANIGRVTSDGVQTNNVGQTKGAGTGTFNIGQDALDKLPR